MSPSTPIDHGRLLTTLDDEAELVLRTCEGVTPDAPVPTCPGWTVSEVVRHVGSVSRVALGWLRTGSRPHEWQSDPVAGQTVRGYLRDGVAELSGLLARHDPAEPAGSWWDADRSHGFWYRRMAHELTVHRVDVQLAAGLDVSDIAEDLALDGVDEALSLWFGHRLRRMGVTGTRSASVTVRAGEHAWAVDAGPDGTTVRPEPERAATARGETDAVVSGTAVSVYLWLWGRAGPGAVTVEGDDDAVGQLWALMRLATR
ncbi:maleylpyruvate isomerase family mycothiol-dependent enzyme [Saccharomonospora saliphila]|uniref:maleylpyruvate isomerase family mycothiol-dependent enzyme n=1 Tax=Saccharomonospora saliphila TaxID=369829 RepID=UPI0004907526|nr:maleylpyruvate isomerase family mycothiol-dependent enzyme [Saccharomonospora saliphila]